MGVCGGEKISVGRSISCHADRRGGVTDPLYVKKRVIQKEVAIGYGEYTGCVCERSRRYEGYTYDVF
jgi:hypothetical protein